MKNNGSILTLFFTFFKIGLTTFGGGYAMIPVMQREFAEKKKWVSEEEMTEMIAISESTPGPLAINAATFIGNRTAGFAGAFFSTLRDKGTLLLSCVNRGQSLCVTAFFLEL